MNYFRYHAWEHDEERRDYLWKHTQSKLQRLPNTEYLELWLQRFSVPQNLEADYQGKMCELVDHLRKEKPEPLPILWNLNWVKKVHKDLGDLDCSSIVDLDNLNEAGPTISIDEYPLWEYY